MVIMKAELKEAVLFVGETVHCQITFYNDRQEPDSLAWGSAQVLHRVSLTIFIFYHLIPPSSIAKQIHILR